MVPPGTAVREGRAAQGGIFEGMAEHAFGPGERLRRVSAHCTFVVLSKCTVSETFAM